MANYSIPTCYSYHYDEIEVSNLLTPCGGLATANTFCCDEGHICMENGLCRFTHTVPDRITSGYYVGGCTDSTFKDPACREACSRLRTADVVYNETIGFWQCCQRRGDGETDCAHPGTAESFAAPPPESLSAAPSYTPPPFSFTSPPAPRPSSTGSTTSLVASSSLTSPQPPAFTTPLSSSSSKEVSSSAKAGIGVGVAAASFAVIIALAIFLLKRRQTQRRQEDICTDGEGKHEVDAASHPFILQGDTLEISGAGIPHELDGKPRSELGG